MPTDLRSTIFNINLTTESPECGSLLVAEPFLSEECFNHAVILLVDHGEGYPSMGLTLNKKSDYNLSDIVNEVNKNIEVPVFNGGPVGDDRMFYLHTLPGLFNESIEVAKGLYIGGDYNQVLEYVNAGCPTDGLLRFYVGYSGWEPGQLAKEIEQNVWAVTKPRNYSKLLTGNPGSLWHKTVSSMGPRYRGWKLHPINPWAN